MGRASQAAAPTRKGRKLHSHCIFHISHDGLADTWDRLYGYPSRRSNRRSRHAQAATGDGFHAQGWSTNPMENRYTTGSSTRRHINLGQPERTRHRQTLTSRAVLSSSSGDQRRPSAVLNSPETLPHHYLLRPQRFELPPQTVEASFWLASGWIAVNFSYLSGGSNPAELWRRRMLWQS